jgi:hypothetical protein
MLVGLGQSPVSVLSGLIFDNPLAPLGGLGGEGGEPVRPSTANGPERSEGAQGKLREPGEGSPRGNTIVKNQVRHHTSIPQLAFTPRVSSRPEEQRNVKQGSQSPGAPG